MSVPLCLVVVSCFAQQVFSSLTWELQSKTKPVIGPMDAFTDGLLCVYNDPCVFKMTPTSYAMFLSCSRQNYTYDRPLWTFRASSNDGVQWTVNPEPVIKNGTTPGSMDFFGAETPTVVYFRGMFHMYYTAELDHVQAGTNTIGHAVSADSYTWTKPTLHNPVITSSTVGYGVGEPGAVVYNNLVMLYFLAFDIAKGICVHVATSDDGYVFTAPVCLFQTNHTIYNNDTYLYISTPQPTLVDGKVSVFHDQYQTMPYASRNLQIALHRTAIGDFSGVYGPIISDSAPAFRANNPTTLDPPFGPLVTWADYEIRGPSVVQDGNSLRMYFAGSNFQTILEFLFNGGSPFLIYDGIGWGNTSYPDTSAPFAHGAYPIPDSSSVACNTYIEAYFTEEMNPVNSVLSVYPTMDSGAPVSGTQSWPVVVATRFVPATALQPNTTYTVSLQASASDKVGNVISGSTTFSFTTVLDCNGSGPGSSTSGSITHRLDSVLVAFSIALWLLGLV